jgi:diguanylate cyclase (GGDEF)-like protein/PAS domain S-box-containing protein
MSNQSNPEDVIKLRQLEALLESINDHLWIIDTKGRYVAANPAFLNSIQKHSHQVLGKTAREVFDDERGDLFWRADLEVMAGGQTVLREDEIVNSESGETEYMELIKTPIRDAHNEIIGLAGIARNTSNRIKSAQALKRAYSELYEFSIRDGLTQCFNRRHTLQLAAEALEAGDLALIMVDLDHFKAINDQYGHASGDAVLVAVSEAIQKHLHTSSKETSVAAKRPCLGRLGGEEFCVLLPRYSHIAALNVAESLRADIASLRISEVSSGGSGICITPSASFGVSVFCKPEMTVGKSLDAELALKQLLKRADDALYRAKQLGRNRVESDR